MDFVPTEATFRKYVLIIDDMVPEFDKDSGSRRLTGIIQLLLKNGIGVYLLGDAKEYRLKPKYIQHFKNMGVIVYEPALDQNRKLISKEAFVGIAASKISCAWLHRPMIFNKYFPIIKGFNTNLPVFFDMVDFHYLRMKREGELTQNPKKLKRADSYLQIELDNCKKADKIIAISESEKKEVLKYYPQENKMIVVGNIHQHIELDNFPSFDERKDLLFIGGFSHEPNQDAVQFLHEEIMPLVWKTNPEIKINIIGSNPPKKISQMHSEKFNVIGYVEEVTPYFLSSRLFVAPLRYGAGIKGKIGQSLEFSLPLITTNIGAEGYDFSKIENEMIAEKAADFAQKIINVYQDKAVWETLSGVSKEIIAPFSVAAIEKSILQLLES